MLKRQFIAFVGSLIIGTLGSFSANAQLPVQNGDSYLTKLTPWGDPIIQGVWDRKDESVTNCKC